LKAQVEETMRQHILSAMLIAFFLLIPNVVFSNEISDLKEEIKKIEEKDRVLQEELKAQKQITDRLLKKMEALENNGSILLGDEEELEGKPVDHYSERYSDSGRSVDIPKLKISGFMDSGFYATLSKHDHHKTFKLGEIDLFMASKISERVNFLAELVAYPFSTNPRYVFEWQRAELRYSFSDHFNITIGRLHTALGYWNHAYHHGTWLQTTIHRPEIYRFEYDNGLLPVHSIGIEFSGTHPVHLFEVEYHLGILNGRDKDIQSIHNFNDANDAKAANMMVSVKPNFLEGLQVGANMYIDQIPSNPAPAGGAPIRTGQIAERIIGLHLVYLQDRIEFLTEFFKLYHHDRPSGNDFNTAGYYIQGGYKIDKWTPYYRFDFINLAEGDPFFIPLQTDLSKQTMGVRWDILTWNALKFEYGVTRQKDKDHEQTFAINASFAF
jgi:hypothetical protein